MEEKTLLLSFFSPNICSSSSVLFFFPITFDLSNYFLSCLKNSLQPVYTLALLFTAFLSKSI